MLLKSLRRAALPRRLSSRRWFRPLLRCLAAALTGAALSGAAVMELPVPLLPAYLCALTFGPEAVAAYLGAAAGYLLLWETADVLEPLAAGLLILSGLGLFRDLLPDEQRWFRSAAGSALYALVSLIFLLQGPMQPFEITFFFLKLAVLAAFTAAFTGPRRRGALTLAWIAGCAKLVFPGDLSLGAVLAAAAVCRALDGTNYLLTAAACGLTLDVCREPLLSATFLYTASALAAHAAPLRTRIGRALLFACTCAVGVLVGGAQEPGLFLTALAGSLLSCFLPKETTPEPAEGDALCSTSWPSCSAAPCLPHPYRMVTRRTAAPRASAQPVFPRHAPSPPINTARWPGCCAPNRRMSPRSTSARSFTPGRAAGYAAQTATASRASATANGFICCSVTAWAPARRPPARQRPPAACSAG